MPAAVGPTETNKGTDWSNRICGKKLPYIKKSSLRNDNFVSRGLQRASTKIGKVFILFHRELMKRTILCMLCTVCSSRANASFLSHSALFEAKDKHLLSVPQPCVCVPLRAEKATSAVIQSTLILLMWRIW